MFRIFDHIKFKNCLSFQHSQNLVKKIQGKSTRLKNLIVKRETSIKNTFLLNPTALTLLRKVPPSTILLVQHHFFNPLISTQ